ncbi:hypothetical protein Q3G72_008010 [Acer saccharum]|nr:hypothetical protein Q3G72_008010 [Acer saccharum]
MYESNIQHLWKDTKFLGNLRRIGLFKCKQLTEVPDLSQAPKLQIMQLHSTLSKYSFCKKARFHFSPSKDGCKVKKCGVHLVYSELEDEICKKARFYFPPSKDGCEVKKCGVYSELEDESTESIRGRIAKEDREEEYFDSESEVINTLCRPFFSNEAPNPRLLSVRAQIPGSDGFGSNKSVNLTDKESPIESSSSSTFSAIDFLTLCHSLKVWNLANQRMDQSWNKRPESIADHMYRMALMALIVGEVPGLNR